MIDATREHWGFGEGYYHLWAGGGFGGGAGDKTGDGGENPAGLPEGFTPLVWWGSRKQRRRWR